MENHSKKRINIINSSIYNIYQITKRTIDIFASMIGLILLSPVFILIAIAIKIEENSGTIFFEQDRIGFEGKSFKIYKFRSMRIDADEQLRNNEQLYKKYLSHGYKLEPNEDPRITNIGKILRKTSLDELPQLFNVLKGDMSLVGPRPIVLEELREYEKEMKVAEFLSMKPGITGIWATSGRSNIGYPERVYLELQYIDKRNIFFDIKIIFKTIIKVFRKEGAY